MSASSKDLRRAAIASIETNDAGALKIVSDAYGREKDPEVRELYKKKFPFIAERDWH